jgi:hypothetical protein
MVPKSASTNRPSKFGHRSVGFKTKPKVLGVPFALPQAASKGRAYLFVTLIMPVPPLTIAASAVIEPVSYFRRAWPPVFSAVALLINAAWIGLLAFWLFELVAAVF